MEETASYLTYFERKCVQRRDCDMLFENLTEEQLEELASLESTEESLRYLQELEVELTDEQLEQVSGGISVRDIYKVVRSRER